MASQSVSGTEKNFYVADRIFVEKHMHTVHFCIIYINAYIHACIHTYINTSIDSYIHTFIHTYIHAYIHTYIQADRQTNFYDWNSTLKENHAFLVVSSCLLLLLHVLFCMRSRKAIFKKSKLHASITWIQFFPPWNEQNLLKRKFTWAGTTGTLGWYQSKFVGYDCYESWKITHCVMFSSWNLGMFLWGLGHRLRQKTRSNHKQIAPASIYYPSCPLNRPWSRTDVVSEDPKLRQFFFGATGYACVLVLWLKKRICYISVFKKIQVGSVQDPGLLFQCRGWKTTQIYIHIICIYIYRYIIL